MKYYKLEDILKLDIPNKEELKEKLGKRVFYEYNENVNYGKLTGIEVNKDDIYYIINNENYIPIWKSITIM